MRDIVHPRRKATKRGIDEGSSLYSSSNVVFPMYNFRKRTSQRRKRCVSKNNFKYKCRIKIIYFWKMIFSFDNIFGRLGLYIWFSSRYERGNRLGCDYIDQLYRRPMVLVHHISRLFLFDELSSSPHYFRPGSYGKLEGSGLNNSGLFSSVVGVSISKTSYAYELNNNRAKNDIGKCSTKQW